MSVEIDIPESMDAHTIPTRLIERTVEQVLKAVLPEEDFCVSVNYKSHEQLIIDWFAVN